ncbi:hypothetical protein [Pontibacillus salipaludis]|uniref:Phage protein n=1 Tax=Pontibacillus salipaludis TaxID=1697394 RepID=A0ABQ1PZ87_9BACI|nr:hypothetical protein [Pontibacillus salipaludis]GGD07745.1 hypothetical protein GCM10011389_14090 [Pontibacillus salipaludis]
MSKSKLELYREMSDQKAEKDKVMWERISKEKETLNKLRQSFDEVMKKQVNETKNYTKDLDELSDQIEEQKKLVARREHEQLVFQKTRPNDITFDDISAEFNNEVKPKFIEEKINPAFQKLLEAKNAYARAVFEYDELVEEHEDIVRDYKSTLGKHYEYKVYGIKLTQKERQKHFFSEGELIDIYRGKIPDFYKWDETLKKGLID